MSFLDQFKPLPEDRADFGYLEVGEWDGSDYEYETQVDLMLAPDGSVWAKICDSPDELPLLSAQELEYRAQGKDKYGCYILREAEDTIGVKSMAEDRAACGGWPKPVTVADYLMWIEDEAEVQDDQAKEADSPDEITERTVYAAALQEVAKKLRDQGFRPSAAPWDCEEGVA